MLKRTPSAADRKREANRLAKRAYRARKRRGDVVFNLVLPEFEVLDALLASRRLSEDASRRKALIEQALADVIRDWAKRWKI